MSTTHSRTLLKGCNPTRLLRCVQSFHIYAAKPALSTCPNPLEDALAKIRNSAPTCSIMKGIMASSTRGSMGVVACMSRYMGTPRREIPLRSMVLLPGVAARVAGRGQSVRVHFSERDRKWEQDVHKISTGCWYRTSCRGCLPGQPAQRREGSNTSTAPTLEHGCG